jgi:hypothetical protein
MRISDLDRKGAAMALGLLSLWCNATLFGMVTAFFILDDTASPSLLSATVSASA